MNYRFSLLLLCILSPLWAQNNPHFKENSHFIFPAGKARLVAPSFGLGWEAHLKNLQWQTMFAPTWEYTGESYEMTQENYLAQIRFNHRWGDVFLASYDWGEQWAEVNEQWAGYRSAKEYLELRRSKSLGGFTLSYKSFSNLPSLLKGLTLGMQWEYQNISTRYYSPNSEDKYILQTADHLHDEAGARVGAAYEYQNYWIHLWSQAHYYREIWQKPSTPSETANFQSCLRNQPFAKQELSACYNYDYQYQSMDLKVLANGVYIFPYFQKKSLHHWALAWGYNWDEFALGKFKLQESLNLSVGQDIDEYFWTGIRLRSTWQSFPWGEIAMINHYRYYPKSEGYKLQLAVEWSLNGHHWSTDQGLHYQQGIIQPKPLKFRAFDLD